MRTTSAPLVAAIHNARRCGPARYARHLMPLGVAGGYAALCASMPLTGDDYATAVSGPCSSVDVRPRVSGYLIGVGFKDGDYVRKGQRLFKIDPRPYQAALLTRPGEP